MVDLGIAKLAVIGIVALVVIGPERLPTVARTLGTLLGRAQRYLGQVKDEVRREIELEALHTLQHELTQTATALSQTVQNHLDFSHSASELAASAMAPQIKNATAYPSAPYRIKKKRVRVWRSQRSLILKTKQYSSPHLHLLSGAARVKRYRRSVTLKNSFSSF